jgi:uncharacterized protein
MSDLIIFGAGGRLGRALLGETLARGVAATAAVRDPDRHRTPALGDATLVRADATDSRDIATASRGHKAAIASLYQEAVPQATFYADAARALLAGLAAAEVPRLVMVGGAPTLEVEPGVRMMDTPAFPAEYLPLAEGHAASLEAFRATPSTSVDWLVLTPPPDLRQDGERTGAYRLAGDAPIAGPDGPAPLSYADLAIALVDEALSPTRHRTRAAVAG